MGFFDDSAGGIAGAIGSVVGGGLGLLGSHTSQVNAAAINAANYKAQKEFAQNSIRWRVADAKAAGLHPLAALGASPANYTPSAAIGDSPDYSFLQDVGQNIGRAIDSKRTQVERAEQQEKQDLLFAEELKGRQLQNQETQTRIDSMKWDMAMEAARNAERSVRTQQQVPAMPSLAADGSVMSGQGDATSPSGIQVKPAEIVVNDPQTPFAEAGTHPGTRWLRTATGGYQPVRSEAAQNALEDDVVGSVRYETRNGLGNFSNDERFAPPRSLLPNRGRDGHSWFYDFINGEWYAVKPGDYLRNRPSWLPDKLRRFQGVK